jgi:hypothetical protein
MACVFACAAVAEKAGESQDDFFTKWLQDHNIDITKVPFLTTAEQTRNVKVRMAQGFSNRGRIAADYVVSYGWRFSEGAKPLHYWCRCRIELSCNQKSTYWRKIA